MSDYDLIDIENKIINELSDSCDMNQEADIFINSQLSQTHLFGDALIDELQKSLLQYSETMDSLPDVSTIEYLRHCKLFMKGLNLMSVRSSGYHTVLARFSSILHLKSGHVLSEHQKTMNQLEIIHTGMHEAHSRSRETALSFQAFFHSCIHFLSRFDKDILLGKCVIEKLRPQKEHPDKNTARKTMKKKVFTLELEKNIPMQIITRLQIINELYDEYFTTFDTQLYKNFIIFQQKYRQLLCMRQQIRKKADIRQKLLIEHNKEFDQLCLAYNKILDSLRTLIIIKEDIKEKTDDFDQTIKYLISANK